MFGLSGLRRGHSRRVAPESLQARNIRFLSLDTAVQGIISAGIGSFLAVFLVRLGASTFTVGLLTSLPALLTIFLSVPAGAYTEGRRDQVRLVNLWRLPIRVTYLLVALVPFLFLGEGGALVVVVLWGLTALPSAIINTAWTVVVADIIPPEARPRVNGNRWALLSIVTALAVAAFGNLLDAIVFPLNYQIVFAVSFLAGIVSILLFARIRVPDEVTLASARAVQKRGLREMVAELGSSLHREGDFARFVLSAQVYRIGLNLPVALFPIYWVQHLNASDTSIGLRTTAANAALVVGYYLWGRFAARRGHRQVLILSAIGLSLYPILTALATAPEWLVPAALVWGAFAPGIDIAFFEVLLGCCPAERRATYVSLNSAFANLVIFAAPLVGTFLAGLFDIRLVLVLSGCVSLVGAMLFYLLAVAGQEAAPAVSG